MYKIDKAERLGLKAEAMFYEAWLKNPIRKRLAYWLRRWVCEHCGHMGGVQLESSRTVYHHDEVRNSRKDPNRDVGLCRSCAQRHHEYWDEMWEYGRNSY